MKAFEGSLDGGTVFLQAKIPTSVYELVEPATLSDGAHDSKDREGHGGGCTGQHGHLVPGVKVQHPGEWR